MGAYGERPWSRSEHQNFARKLYKRLTSLETSVGVAQTPEEDQDEAALLVFFDLQDVTPDTYEGQANKIVRVESAEGGLEFASLTGTVNQIIVTPGATEFVLSASGQFQIWDAAAQPYIRIINKSDDERDPVLQFALGASPVVVFTMGVDDSDVDDAFRLDKGATLGGELVLYSGNTNTLLGEGICSGATGDPAEMMNSVIIGDHAAPLAEGYWEDNVIIGSEAGKNVRDWYATGTDDGIWDSVIIGAYAASGVVATVLGISSVIALGFDVLYGAKGYFVENIFIGNSAGAAINTTGQSAGLCGAIVIGTNAFNVFTPTNNNWGGVLAIGNNSLHDCIDDLIENDTRIIALGNESFHRLKYGTGNVGVGTYAFYGGGATYPVASPGGLNYCTAVGDFAGGDQDTPADGLCFFGYYAGDDVGRYGYTQGDVIAIGRSSLDIVSVAGTPYFTTEKGSIYIGSYSGWDVTNVVPPATGPAGAAAAGAGLEIGTYRYRVSFVLDGKETLLGKASTSTITTTAGNQKINVTSIPTYSGPRVCTARKLYRSKVGGSLYLPYYYVATIGDNVTTTYADTTPDASLTAVGDTTSYSIALGYGAKIWAAHQMVIGGDSGGYIDDVYLGNGIVNATPVDVVLNATGGVGTDIAAADLILAGGRATGNAASGDIVFKTGTVGASGTALQTLAERFSILAGVAGARSLYPITQVNCSAPAAVPDCFVVYSADVGGVAGHAAPHWIGEAGGIASLECGAGAVHEYRYYADLADDAVLTLPFSITSSARGFISVGDNEERTGFWIDNDGDVTLVNNSANVVANADTDANLCMGTAATQEPLQIKNRLGSTKKIFIVMWYN